MSDSWYSASSPDKRRGSSRQLRRGAGLALVFASVLATGAATGAWGDGMQAVAGSRDAAGDASANAQFGGGSYGDTSSRAAGLHKDTERVREDGASGGEEAEELVSRSGDRWSSAYTAREFEGLRRTLDGEYVGVGISVRRDRDAQGSPSVVVARVAPDSPADRAGVRAGDRLRSVDGEHVSDHPVTDVVARLRGSENGGRSADPSPLGSSVRLGLERGGRHRTETLHRARLNADAVTVDRMRRGVTRIKVTSFTKGSARQVRDAAESARGGSGILLDLRGNSGGLVHEAVTAASVFLEGGLVATYEQHGAQRALYADTRPGTASHGRTAPPLVVLVDGGTMSAAELLTGALQDRGRAVVVGSRTFGKGSVQMPRKLPDGSVAELTVGHYATPSGRSLDGEGITPDLVIDGAGDAAERARTVLSGLEARS
ncbi:carboxyl-terminal processing protease [Streptomyces sp. Amel2xB2]|uniref:S41 family peptidase n=1 Tax=Streptomyces sp. Amel2xB2 TaxID=1305829 RepID=UPI000DBA79B1|nr:S41 family peptidase [Streptomyces sp. Amel2xB2]RAJ69646.1 carboxyl-terminal processing protease [Streptomyces sp. Amel2xB2]